MGCDMTCVEAYNKLLPVATTQCIYSINSAKQYKSVDITSRVIGKGEDPSSLPPFAIHNFFYS
jgi:hypothetical protein